MEITMAPGILGKIDVVIFSLFGLYILNLVLILGILRIRYSGTWQQFRDLTKNGHHPIPAIRQAVMSDPGAGSNSYLDVGLAITEALMYPIGLLILIRIAWAIIIASM